MTKEGAPEREKLVDATTGVTLADKYEAAKLAVEEARKEKEELADRIRARKEEKLADIRAREIELGIVAKEDTSSIEAPVTVKGKKGIVGRKNEDRNIGRKNRIGIDNKRYTSTDSDIRQKVEDMSRAQQEARKPKAPKAETKKVSKYGFAKSFELGANAVANREGLTRETMRGVPDMQKEEEVLVPKHREPYSTPSPFEGMQFPDRDYKADLERVTKSYEEKGLGTIVSKLSALPGYAELEEGQKMLLIQAVGDKLHQHVRETASQAFKEDHAKSGMFKKLLKGATKNYRIASNEKKVFNDVVGKDAESFVGAVAPDLLDVFKQNELKGYLSKDGKTIITDYVALEGMPPLMRMMSEEYNVAASSLARIPYEWSLPGATSDQAKAYKKAYLGFEMAKSRFLPELSSAFAGKVDSPKFYAANKVALSEKTIQTMSFLSAHPDVLGRLEKIASRPAILRMYQDTTTERALLVGGGALARGVGRTIGVAAAPVIGGIVGYYRGKMRAKESLREADKLARYGAAQNEATKMVMNSADTKIGDINKYRARLMDAANPIERQKAFTKLKLHADLVEQRLSSGQINFGTEHQFLKQYNLMRTLYEARTAIEVFSKDAEIMSLFNQGDEQGDHGRALEARINRIVEGGNARTEKNRTEMIGKQARTSMYLGAGAGALGAALHYFGSEFNWFGGSKSAVSADVSNKAEFVPNAGRSAQMDSPIRHSVDSGKAPLNADTSTALHENLSVDSSGKLVDSAESNTGTITTETTTAIETTTTTVKEAAEEAKNAVDTEHAIARVEFSSRGAQQTLLDFRHTAEFKNLPADQQKFFEQNIVKISEQLKGFRPDAADGKESLNVGVGSEFGVTADGKIYIIDKLRNETHVLGHFENGGFVSDANESELHYIHAGRVSNSETMSVDKDGSLEHSPKQTPEELGIRTDKPWEKDGSMGPIADAEAYAKYMDEHAPVASPIKVPEEMQADMNGYNEDLSDIDPEYVSYNDPHAYTLEEELTPGKLARVERITDRMVRHQVNRFFTYRGPSGFQTLGQYSPVWASYANRPAYSILGQNINNYQPYFRPFVRHMRALADKYPDVSLDQPLGFFMKEAYRHKAEERVVGHVVERQ